MYRNIRSLQRLKEGQPLRLSASSYNAIAEYVENAANGVNTARFTESGNDILVRCKNATTATIDAFTLVSLTTPTLDSTLSGTDQLYNATPTLSSSPQSTDVLGITQESISSGNCGAVMLYGVSVLEFGVHPSGTYATPNGSGGFTFSNDSGSIRILYSPASATYALAIQCIGGNTSTSSVTMPFDAKCENGTIYYKGGRILLGLNEITVSDGSISGTDGYLYLELSWRSSYSATISLSSTYKSNTTDGEWVRTLAHISNGKVTEQYWHGDITVEGRWI